MKVLNYRNYTESKHSSRRSLSGLRERVYTLGVMSVAIVQLFACGSPSNTTSQYQRAMGKQEACCQGLQDGAQQQACMQKIVRIGDESIEKTELNEATFQCVETNFVCSAATGQATPEANQATYDCITNLQ